MCPPYNGRITIFYNSILKFVPFFFQLMVEIQRKHLKVLIKKSEKSSEFETVIDDELQHEVNREESMWSLESGKHINVS